MTTEFHKVIVPVNQEDVRLFADAITASRLNGVYKMIANARTASSGGGDDPQPFDVQAMRDGFDTFADTAVARKPRAATRIDVTHVAGVPAHRLRPAGSLNEGTLIYLHGGGFTIGSVKGELGVADSFACSLCLETVALDYAQAPEHPFPEGIEDVFNVIRAVQLQKPDGLILLAGDSAGGSLAISAALRLRDQNLPLVGGVISVSAMLDWRLQNESWTTFEDRDLVTLALAMFFRDGYLGNLDPADPRASPALADLTRLPPTLLIVGGAETLLDDTLALAENAARSGCDIETHVFDQLPHNFIKFAHPSADRAFELAATWARSRGFTS